MFSMQGDSKCLVEPASFERRGSPVRAAIAAPNDFQVATAVGPQPPPIASATNGELKALCLTLRVGVDESTFLAS